MASGLAARIKDIFGIPGRLVEGHNGIYEIAVNGRTIVTNQGKCSLSSSEDEILNELRKYINPMPGKEKMLRAVFPVIKGLT